MSSRVNAPIWLVLGFSVDYILAWPAEAALLFRSYFSDLCNIASVGGNRICYIKCSELVCGHWSRRFTGKALSSGKVSMFLPPGVPEHD